MLEGTFLLDAAHIMNWTGFNYCYILIFMILWMFLLQSYSVLYVGIIRLGFIIHCSSRQNGVLIFFFLFLHENICCGYSLGMLEEALLMNIHNLCFHGEIRLSSGRMVPNFGSRVPGFKFYKIHSITAQRFIAQSLSL